MGMGKELKKVRCNFARDLLIKAAVIPMTIDETLGGSSCSTCANEIHKSSSTSTSKNALLKGGGHANFDAEFFVPMDSLGDAQVKNNTFKLLKFH